MSLPYSHVPRHVTFTPPAAPPIYTPAPPAPLTDAEKYQRRLATNRRSGHLSRKREREGRETLERRLEDAERRTADARKRAGKVRWEIEWLRAKLCEIRNARATENNPTREITKLQDVVVANGAGVNTAGQATLFYDDQTPTDSLYASLASESSAENGTNDYFVSSRDVPPKEDETNDSLFMKIMSALFSPLSTPAIDPFEAVSSDEGTGGGATQWENNNEAEEAGLVLPLHTPVPDFSFLASMQDEVASDGAEDGVNAHIAQPVIETDEFLSATMQDSWVPAGLQYDTERREDEVEEDEIVRAFEIPPPCTRPSKIARTTTTLFAISFLLLLLPGQLLHRHGHGHKAQIQHHFDDPQAQCIAAVTAPVCFVNGSAPAESQAVVVVEHIGTIHPEVNFSLWEVHHPPAKQVPPQREAITLGSVFVVPVFGDVSFGQLSPRAVERQKQS